MGVLSASPTVTMATSATDLKPWPMSGPLNHAEFPGYNPHLLPNSATLITNYLESNNVHYRRHVQQQQQQLQQHHQFNRSAENEYVTSPCRKSMYSVGPPSIPLYETVRPKSACYVEDELNLKGKDYLPLSSIVHGHYRQKSEVVTRPSVPPPLPPSRPASSNGVGGQNEFSYMEGQVPLRRVIEAEAAGAAAAALRAPAPVTCVPPSWLKKMKVIKKIKRRIGSRMGSQKVGTNFNNLPPLRFDTVIHGENVQVSPDGRVASRINSFCKGIVFTDRPVKIHEKVCIYLREILKSNWSGVLRFGFTSVNPAVMRNSLPKYVCPDLTCRPGFWAKAFSDSLLVTEDEALLTFHLTSSGDVQFSLNGENMGVFLTGVDTRKPLWAVVDVYGNTTCVELIDPRTHIINNNLRTEACNSYSSNNNNNNTAPPLTPRLEPRYVTTTSLPAPSAASQPRHSHSLSYIQACTPPRSSNSSASSLYQQSCSRRPEYFEMAALARALPQSTPATPERRLPSAVSRTSCASAASSAVSQSQASCSSSSSVYHQVPRHQAYKSVPTTSKAAMMNVQVEERHQQPLLDKCNGQYYDCGQQRVVVRTAPNTPKAQRVLRASDDYETIYSCKSAIKNTTSAPAPSCSSSSSSSLKAKIQSVEDYKEVCSSSPPKSSLASSISANDDSPSKDQLPITLECLACCERPVDSVFYSCGHMCMCYQCAVGYWSSEEKGHCPICRSVINDVIRTYM